MAWFEKSSGPVDANRMNSPNRPITILICALGGEGGGVLTEWLVEAALLAKLPMQAPSVPGVAQ